MKSIIRKLMAASIFLLIIFIFGGCKNENADVQIAVLDGNNNNQSGVFICPIMKTENGYYYHQTGIYNFHYYDNVSDKNVFLCNKPECLHMGDEFCTATNEHYIINGSCFYDERIFISAYDTRDTENVRLVLLRLEADGSGLTELVELKNSIKPDIGYAQGDMFIHRGVCFVSYALAGEDKFLYGTSVYNLLSNNLTQMEEYEFTKRIEGYYSSLGCARERFMGNGDYVYFNETRPMGEGKKTKTYICRYNINTSSVEEAKRDGTYGGTYCITDEDRTMYIDTFGNVHSYDWKTQKDTKTAIPEKPDDYFKEHPGAYYETATGISDIVEYEGNIIVLGSGAFFDLFPIMIEGDYQPAFFVKILDKNLNLMNFFSMREMFSEVLTTMNDVVDQYQDAGKYIENDNKGFYARLAIEDEDLYLLTNRCVFSIPMADFLNGTGKFTISFRRDFRQ